MQLTERHLINKYIKANNERFSTPGSPTSAAFVSISRRIMKDSQPYTTGDDYPNKYIKANNERFSTKCLGIISLS